MTRKISRKVLNLLLDSSIRVLMNQDQSLNCLNQQKKTDSLRVQSRRICPPELKTGKVLSETTMKKARRFLCTTKTLTSFPLKTTNSLT